MLEETSRASRAEMDALRKKNAELTAMVGQWQQKEDATRTELRASQQEVKNLQELLNTVRADNEALKVI